MKMGNSMYEIVIFVLKKKEKKGNQERLMICFLKGVPVSIHVTEDVLTIPIIQLTPKQLY